MKIHTHLGRLLPRQVLDSSSEGESGEDDEEPHQMTSGKRQMMGIAFFHQSVDGAAVDEATPD